MAEHPISKGEFCVVGLLNFETFDPLFDERFYVPKINAQEVVMHTLSQNTWSACRKPKKKPHEEPDNSKPSE